MGIFPAIDPLLSNSSILTEKNVGVRHYQLAQKTLKYFQMIEELKNILATITPADYDNMLPYVEENYRLGQHYWHYSIHQRIEQIIAETIPNLIDSSLENLLNT
jgi:hypothetical protein